MKPQDNLKKTIFIFALLLACTAFSQNKSKKDSKTCCSKIELKSTQDCTTISTTKVVKDKLQTPVLSKAISSLNNKIDHVIIENKMVSVRNTTSISFTYRD